MFRQETDAAFHEQVAREHLERGASAFDLHRSYRVPLAAVKRWIALYQAGGRPALEVAAAEIARREARPLAPRELAVLAEQLRSRDAAVVQAALVTVGHRRARPLTNAVFAILSNHRPAEIIEALMTLGDLGAAAHLDRAERLLDAGYAGWVAVARQRLPKAT